MLTSLNYTVYPQISQITQSLKKWNNGMMESENHWKIGILE